ncbi:DUF1579 family protein [Bacillus thuringiensis]|uniref:DUF1579 family protein n=1 Tax=Bacillus thuringiensis TaxID=1428 RepID=UPI0016773DBB|nr:DUF1579 family protein [Bacillus thuringiensis]
MKKESFIDSFLTRLIGTWQANIFIRMNEGDQWLERSGELKNKFLYTKECLFQEFTVNSNVEAIGLNNFDFVRNRYVSIWNENAGTGFMTGYGNWNDNYQILGENGTFSHPVKKTIIDFVSTTEFLNEDTYKKKLYLPASRGGFFEAAILTYTRIN